MANKDVKITLLSGQVSSLNTQIQSLQGQLTTMNTEAANLQTTINNKASLVTSLHWLGSICIRQALRVGGELSARSARPWSLAGP
ncbi:MAG: hypothetical protein NTY03_00920 [Candidatus Bathyarchaeota archaeon]|nr:hypothetical protein [Candidatus Bathyarchaeota archaeon]